MTLFSSQIKCSIAIIIWYKGVSCKQIPKKVKLSRGKKQEAWFYIYCLTYLHVREANGQSAQVLFWQHGAMRFHCVILQKGKKKIGRGALQLQ
jgi:hypothetical protein